MTAGPSPLPADDIGPADLSPLMRTELKDAFRAVTSIQKRLAGELRAERMGVTVEG